MITTWQRDKGILTFDSAKIIVTSVVRNELNGWRNLHDKSQIVYSVNKDRTKGFPIMPRPFPLGVWRITGVEWIDAPNPAFINPKPYLVNPYWPVKILTDAHQLLPTWALDESGGYDFKESRLVDDWAYWLHFLNGSSSTQGCGGIDTENNARLLAKYIEDTLGTKKDIVLEVV